jgi:hypothetical protein
MTGCCHCCEATSLVPAEIALLLVGDDSICFECARSVFGWLDPTTDPDDLAVREEIAEALR